MTDVSLKTPKAEIIQIHGEFWTSYAIVGELTYVKVDLTFMK